MTKTRKTILMTILCAFILLIMAFGAMSFTKANVVYASQTEYLPYEIVDYIDSTGVELIDTEIKVGEYPRLRFEFMLLEESSSFIGGCEQFRLFAEDNQFKSLCCETDLEGDGFVPFKRFAAIIGRQERYQEVRYISYLDLQDSNLSFEYKPWTGTPENKNVTLFGGYLGDETIYSKVRLYEVTLNGVTLKPCRIIESDEYCLVDESTGKYYKDVNGKSFVKDSLVKQTSYIDKDGKETIVTDSYKLRLYNEFGYVSGNIFVDEDISLKTLQLQGDTNLFIYDDVKLTINEGIIEFGNGSNYKLKIFGQTKQTGEIIVKGKDGDSKSGRPAQRAGNGLPAINVKYLEINGCRISFKGGNGGNNDCVHTPGEASPLAERYTAGDGAPASVCEEIIFNRGSVTFESGKGGIASNKEMEALYPGQLQGHNSSALNKQIKVNSDNFSLVGGMSSEENDVLDFMSEDYSNNINYQFVEIDTMSKECPYDVILVDEGVSYPFLHFASCIQTSKTLSDSFVCHIRKDVSIDFELSLGSNETIDLHGHSITCIGLYLINEANIVNTSETIGKIVTNSFVWSNNGLNGYKYIQGFDGSYYIVLNSFEPIECITYSWNGNVCTAKAYHIELNDLLELSVTGEYVKDSDPTCETNEKGHLEATFINSNFTKQVTAKDSVEVPNTQLPKEGLSAGAIVGISVGSVAGACLIAYIAMFIVWKKNGKELKFLTKSFEWINKIFKK